MTEKREFTRVPLSAEVELQAGGRIIRSSSGIDVCMRSVRLKIEEEAPPVGAACTVTIVLEACGHTERLFAEGNILRASAGSLVVRFTSLDFDSYHHLRLLILNNAEDPDKAEQEFIDHWGICKPHNDAPRQ